MIKRCDEKFKPDYRYSFDEVVQLIKEAKVAERNRIEHPEGVGGEMTLREGMHIESCAVGKVNPCIANNGDHRWSGQPGAYCFDCGVSEALNLCVARCCECPCHDDFERLRK